MVRESVSIRQRGGPTVGSDRGIREVFTIPGIYSFKRDWNSGRVGKVFTIVRN